MPAYKIKQDICNTCGVALVEKENWYTCLKDHATYRCKDCHTQYGRNRSISKPFQYHFENVRKRAKSRNIEFTIALSDLVYPTHCPVLGIELDYSYSEKKHRTDNSPSADRIDPNLGYIPGNVIIVSAKANAIKSNATVDEIYKVYAFYEALANAK